MNRLHWPFWFYTIQCNVHIANTRLDQRQHRDRIQAHTQKRCWAAAATGPYAALLFVRPEG